MFKNSKEAFMMEAKRKLEDDARKERSEQNKELKDRMRAMLTVEVFKDGHKTGVRAATEREVNNMYLASQHLEGLLSGKKQVPGVNAPAQSKQPQQPQQQKLSQQPDNQIVTLRQQDPDTHWNELTPGTVYIGPDGKLHKKSGNQQQTGSVQ
jgi:hypothetical protein